LLSIARPAVGNSAMNGNLGPGTVQQQLLKTIQQTQQTFE
jgi:hypothetical protein